MQYSSYSDIVGCLGLGLNNDALAMIVIVIKKFLVVLEKISPVL